MSRFSSPGGLDVAAPVDETANRSGDVQYQNTTGNPLFVSVNSDEDNPSMGFRAYVANTKVSEHFLQGDTEPTVTLHVELLVPADETYTVNLYGSATVQNWTEQEIQT